ncbi:MAG: leucine-rich repeat protein [Clostridia bacterium]|nr:leucine-rich repeat protein [Clostridia bacterium]
MKKIFALAITIVMMFSLTSCGVFEWLIGLKADRTYTIHFNANGGEGEMDDYLVESGDDGWLPKCTFTKEGYECVAWGLDPEGKKYGTQIDNLTFNLPSSVKNGDTVELYAIWTTPGFAFELSTMGYFAHWDITDYDGNANQIIIPAWYEGFYGGTYGSCHVLGLTSELFMGHTEIESVKNIPTSYLPSDLFNGCSSLKTVEIRSGEVIYDIGDRAFYNCTSLQGIELTANLDTIGEEAFYMCTSIEKLVIPAYLEELGNNAFYGWTEDQVIEFTRYSENPFGEEVFNGCKAKIMWSGE